MSPECLALESPYSSCNLTAVNCKLTLKIGILELNLQLWTLVVTLTLWLGTHGSYPAHNVRFLQK